MNVKRIRIAGSNYVGLFCIANDSLCFVPRQTDDKTEKAIAQTLDVKVVKAGLYESPLLAVFAKMNNKCAFVPNFALSKEIEEIEREMKIEIVKTAHALGNMIEVNDEKAIVSTLLTENEVKTIKKTGLDVLQTVIADTNAVGSAMVLNNKGFVIHPDVIREDIKKIQATLNLRGGTATANMGDALVRNSIVANNKGFVTGELTTGHELNRIEEALEK